MKVITRTGFLVGLPAVLIAAWWVSTLLSPSFFVPSPGELAVTFVETWFGPRFFADVLPSVGRLLTGLSIAIVVGVLLGTAIGLSRTLRDLTEPMLEFLRATPPPVLIPVLMLVFGINDQMRVIVIVLGSVWPILLNTIEGVRSIDTVLRDTSAVYRLTPFTRLARLILPGASPQIMTGIRQALSIALILMVISEMFASSSGLGFTIVQFQRTFAIPEMWSGIAVLGLLGLGLSFVFRFVERRLLSWYHGMKEVNRAR